MKKEIEEILADFANELGESYSEEKNINIFMIDLYTFTDNYVNSSAQDDESDFIKKLINTLEKIQNVIEKNSYIYKENEGINSWIIEQKSYEPKYKQYLTFKEFGTDTPLEDEDIKLGDKISFRRYNKTEEDGAVKFNEASNGNYFSFGIETDLNNEYIKTIDKFRDLIDKALKTLKNNEEEKINYYEKALKRYFYVEFLERYRTKQIDEGLDIKINHKFDGSVDSEVITRGTLNRLDGRVETIGSPRSISLSKTRKNTDEVVDNILPASFVIDKGYLEVIIDKDNLTNREIDVLKKTKEAYKISFKKFIEDIYDYYYRAITSGNPYFNLYETLKDEASFNEIWKEFEVSLGYTFIKPYLTELKTTFEDNSQILELFSNDYKSLGIYFENNEIKITLPISKKITFITDEDSIEIGSGYIKKDFITTKLLDIYYSNSQSSENVTRNIHYDANDFFSVMDDKSFVMSTYVKSRKNEYIKKNYQKEENRMVKIDGEYCIDVTKIDEPETLKAIKMVYLHNGKDGLEQVDKTFEICLPVKRIKTVKNFIEKTFAVGNGILSGSVGNFIYNNILHVENSNENAVNFIPAGEVKNSGIELPLTVSIEEGNNSGFFVSGNTVIAIVEEIDENTNTYIIKNLNNESIELKFIKLGENSNNYKISINNGSDSVYEDIINTYEIKKYAVFEKHDFEKNDINDIWGNNIESETFKDQMVITGYIKSSIISSFPGYFPEFYNCDGN